MGNTRILVEARCGMPYRYVGVLTRRRDRFRVSPELATHPDGDGGQMKLFEGVVIPDGIFSVERRLETLGH